MTSYQNHFHDRLRILCRWFRSYTSLFQAFHISMIFAVIGCCDHPNHSLTQKLQVLRYSSFVLHHIVNKTSPQIVRLPSATLCQDQPAVSSPLHEEISAGVPPKPNYDKISHYLPPPPRRRTNARGPKYPLQPGQVAQDQNLGVLLALSPVAPRRKPSSILATGTTNLKMGMSEKCYESLTSLQICIAEATCNLQPEVT